MRKFISHRKRKKNSLPMRKKILLVEFRPRPLRKSTIKNWVKAFFSRHKMADVVTVTEELRSFFASLRSILLRVTVFNRESDFVGLEICQRKVEEHLRILCAVAVKVSSSSFGFDNRLLEAVIDQLVAVVRQISVDLQSEQYNRRNEWLLDRSTSTGGRPAYCITKEQVEQLRETGMNWRTIAKCLGVSDSTLYRRRMELNIASTFTDITDNALFDEIEDILRLTPYSGESYVRGALRGRGIWVQRYRVRDTLARIDPVGRAVRRTYEICRRTYNVHTPNQLWHIDSHHKLISWRFVIHGCIDGYSRTIIYLHCCLELITKPLLYCTCLKKEFRSLGYLQGYEETVV